MNQPQESNQHYLYIAGRHLQHRLCQQVENSIDNNPNNGVAYFPTGSSKAGYQRNDKHFIKKGRSHRCRQDT